MSDNINADVIGQAPAFAIVNGAPFNQLPEDLISPGCPRSISGLV